MPIVRPAVASTELGVRDSSSPVDTVGVDESASTRRRRVPWASRFQAAKAYVGTVQIARDAAIPPQPTRLERLTPLPYPSDEVNWYAVRVPQITPYKATGKAITDADGSSTTFAEADLTINYQPLPYDVIDDAGVAAADEYLRYVSHSDWQSNADVLLLQSGSMYYVRVDGTKLGTVPFNKPLPQPSLTFRATWHRLPADLFDGSNKTPWLKRVLGDPDTGQRTWMNTVNKTAIWGYPAGTLLVRDWTPERRSEPFVGYEYDVHFTMQWRPDGHNFLYYNDLDSSEDSGYYFVRRETGGAVSYQAPGSVDDGTSLFDEREFRALFYPQAVV